MIKYMETELLHLIKEIWDLRIALKYMAMGYRENDEWLCSKWDLSLYIYFILNPIQHMASFHSSGVDSAVYFPDQHINFTSVTPARQPESINLKASKSMDLGKQEGGDIQVTLQPRPIYLPKCPGLVSSAQTSKRKACRHPEEGIMGILSS